MILRGPGVTRMVGLLVLLGAVEWGLNPLCYRKRESKNETSEEE